MQDSSQKNIIYKVIFYDFQLSECINGMRENNSSSTNPAHHQEVLIKRYQEIHFDYSAEFKNTSVL